MAGGAAEGTGRRHVAQLPGLRLLLSRFPRDDGSVLDIDQLLRLEPLELLGRLLGTLEVVESPCGQCRHAEYILSVADRRLGEVKAIHPKAWLTVSQAASLLGGDFGSASACIGSISRARGC